MAQNWVANITKHRTNIIWCNRSIWLCKFLGYRKCCCWIFHSIKIHVFLFICHEHYEHNKQYLIGLYLWQTTVSIPSIRLFCVERMRVPDLMEKNILIIDVRIFSKIFESVIIGNYHENIILIMNFDFLMFDFFLRNFSHFFHPFLEFHKG